MFTFNMHIYIHEDKLNNYDLYLFCNMYICRYINTDTQTHIHTQTYIHTYIHTDRQRRGRKRQRHTFLFIYFAYRWLLSQLEYISV